MPIWLPYTLGAVLCPLVMGVTMFFMMREMRGHPRN